MFPASVRSSMSVPLSTVMFVVPVICERVRISLPPVTCTAPALTELPLTRGAPAVTLIEPRERPVRSFCVDGPVKTRSSPFFGATPPFQFAPLLQRALPPAPVQIRVAAEAADEMSRRLQKSERRVAVFKIGRAHV